MARLAFVFQHVALEELHCEVLMRFEENFDDQLVNPAHHDERLKVLLSCELTTSLF